MELFDELVECDVAIVAPHLQPLIQFCLEVAINKNLGNNIRVKALSFVSWLATLKKKVFYLREGGRERGRDRRGRFRGGGRG